jgi:hypothetical protein
MAGIMTRLEILTRPGLDTFLKKIKKSTLMGDLPAGYPLKA